ncbi:hypothetical protein [Streptomyces sp. TRM68367]|nr:hypothetical protein [Streptomyces sp. TRM68367]
MSPRGVLLLRRDPDPESAFPELQHLLDETGALARASAMAETYAQ